MKNRKIIWSSSQSKILVDLFDSLDKNKIRFFVLRNYEGLPHKNISKDIDIIVDPDKINESIVILREVLLQNNISNLKIVKYEMAHCCYASDVDKDFAIHIDLIAGYKSRGFEIFNFETLYAETIDYKGFKVLNDSYDGLMLLLYKVIGPKDLKQRYRDRITKSYIQNTSSFNAGLHYVFGKNIANQLSKLIENQNYQKIIEMAEMLSKKSKSKCLYRHPVKSVAGILKFYFEKIYRILWCPKKFQYFISVQGADGTGKTTFINGLEKEINYFSNSDGDKCRIRHFRPTLLPNLGAVGESTGVMKQDKDFTNPHRGSKTSFFNSFIRIFYYWLDYAVGVRLLIRKDVQFDHFTIFDRYIYDFLIDPKRSRIYLPYFIRHFFSVIVPQPRIVFILLAPADVVYARKQELTMEEIQRQFEEYTKLAKTNKRFVILNADQKPEKVVEDAMKVIMNRLIPKVK